MEEKKDSMELDDEELDNVAGGVGMETLQKSADPFGKKPTAKKLPATGFVGSADLAPVDRAPSARTRTL